MFYIFLIRYKILRNPANLSRHINEFFKLSSKNQRHVVDKYFKAFGDDDIASYFVNNEARYYDNGKEITMFNCYYFDKMLIENNIYNLSYIDKFNLPQEKSNYLIEYALKLIKENELDFEPSKIIVYLDELPFALSQSMSFVNYLVSKDLYLIKYMTYNEKCPEEQRELIKKVIHEVSDKEFSYEKFLKSDKSLAKILRGNIDFILYLIRNDIKFVSFLDDKTLRGVTNTNYQRITQTIIAALEKSSDGLENILENSALAEYLCRDDNFIIYMLKIDLDNVKYVDWHNLSDITINKIINVMTNLLNNSSREFDIMKCKARDLFFQNYNFMCYLIKKDFRWIAVTMVSSNDENTKLTDLFFDELKGKKYKFRLQDFLSDGKYINYNLVQNKKMLHYFFVNNVKLVQHIDFFHLKDSRAVVENIVDELEKCDSTYEFNNDDYLIDNKYPVLLSNSYRFMRYVIDKNFNNISYMDTSMIDNKELKRIINYACRMVYYIRGNNKKLSFDIEGYFKNSDVIKNEYFQECLKSL